jgi:hypothetical protein
MAPFICAHTGANHQRRSVRKRRGRQSAAARAVSDRSQQRSRLSGHLSGHGEVVKSDEEVSARGLEAGVDGHLADAVGNLTPLLAEQVARMLVLLPAVDLQDQPRRRPARSTRYGPMVNCNSGAGTPPRSIANRAKDSNGLSWSGCRLDAWRGDRDLSRWSQRKGRSCQRRNSQSRSQRRTTFNPVDSAGPDPAT